MNSLLTSTRLFVWTNVQNDYETSCISFVMVKSPGLLWFLSALPHRRRAEVKKSAHVRSSVRAAVKHWTAPLVLVFLKNRAHWSRTTTGPADTRLWVTLTKRLKWDPDMHCSRKIQLLLPEQLWLTTYSALLEDHEISNHILKVKNGAGNT